MMVDLRPFCREKWKEMSVDNESGGADVRESQRQVLRVPLFGGFFLGCWDWVWTVGEDWCALSKVHAAALYGCSDNLRRCKVLKRRVRVAIRMLGRFSFVGVLRAFSVSSSSAGLPYESIKLVEFFRIERSKL